MVLLLGSDLSAFPFTRGAKLLFGGATGDADAVAAWQWAHGSSRLDSTAFNFSAGPSFICNMPVRWSSVRRGRPAPSILCSRKFWKQKKLCLNNSARFVHLKMFIGQCSMQCTCRDVMRSSFYSKTALFWYFIRWLDNSMLYCIFMAKICMNFYTYPRFQFVLVGKILYLC